MQVKVKRAIFGLGAYAHEASPVVTGLQKPPAGSEEGEEGEEEEEMVPVGMRLLIWAGASPFHTGDCATTEQLCLQLHFSRSPGEFSAPTAGRSSTSLKSSQAPSAAGPTHIPTHLALYLKVTWSS
jgi:hypothetical protein